MWKTAALAWTHRSFRFAYLICICVPDVRCPGSVTTCFLVGELVPTTFVFSELSVPVSFQLLFLLASCWGPQRYEISVTDNFGLTGSRAPRDLTLDRSSLLSVCLKGSSLVTGEITLPVPCFYSPLLPSRKPQRGSMCGELDCGFLGTPDLSTWLCSSLVPFVSVPSQDLSLCRSCLHPVSSLEGKRAAAWQHSFLSEYINQHHSQVLDFLFSYLTGCTFFVVTSVELFQSTLL